MGGGGGIRNSCKNDSLMQYFDTENCKNVRDTYKIRHNGENSEDSKLDLISCENNDVFSQQPSKHNGLKNIKLNNSKTDAGARVVKQSKVSYKKYLSMIFCVVIMFLGMLMGMTYASLSSSKTATGTISFTLPQGVSAGFEASMPTLFLGTTAQDAYCNGNNLTSISSATYTLNCKKSGQYLRLQFTLPNGFDCSLSSNSLSANGLTWQLSYNATNNTLVAYTSSATTNASYKTGLDVFLRQFKTTLTQESIINSMRETNASEYKYSHSYSFNVGEQISVVANMSASKIDASTTFSSQDADVTIKCVPKMLLGAGTEESPYEIRTKNDFMTFMYTSNYYKTASVALKNNLDLIENYKFKRDDAPWNELTGNETLTNCVEFSNGTIKAYIPPFIAPNNPAIFWHNENNTYEEWGTQDAIYYGRYISLYNWENFEEDETLTSFLSNFIYHLYVIYGFNGKFDGEGHALTGYFPYSLFYDCNDVVIKNLTVNGCAGGSGIAGRANGATISGCTNNAIVLAWYNKSGLVEEGDENTGSDIMNAIGDLMGIAGICGGNTNGEYAKEIINCVNNSVLDINYSELIKRNVANYGIGVAKTIKGCTNNGRIRGGTIMAGIGKAGILWYCNNYGTLELINPTDDTILSVNGISCGYLNEVTSYVYYCKNYGDVYFGFCYSSNYRAFISGIGEFANIENCYSVMQFWGFINENTVGKKAITNTLNNDYIFGITYEGEPRFCYYYELLSENNGHIKPGGRGSYIDNTNFDALMVYNAGGKNHHFLNAWLNTIPEVEGGYKGKLSVEEAMAQYALDKGY